MANKDIKIGEQILWNYNYDFDDKDIQKICNTKEWLDLCPNAEQCFACHKRKKDLNKCNDCRYAQYCGNNCQNSDRKRHKKYCSDKVEK